MALRSAAWAKSQRNAYGELEGWLPLVQHMADSAAVAGRLWDSWLPQAQRDLLASQVGEPEWARRLLVCLAYLHDIGKASPAFVAKDPDLRLRAERLGLPAGPVVPNAAELPHGLAGYLFLSEALEGELGLRREESRGLAVVVGGHHGVPPSDLQLRAARTLWDARGTGAWEEARSLLMAPALAELARIRAEGASLALDRPAQALLSGAVIMSDWIASSAEQFELFPPGWRAPAGYDPAAAAEQRCAAAWRALQFPAAWRGQALPPDWVDSFAQRFGLPGPVAPNATQVAAAQLAAEGAGPGVLVIEAPMGVGKTEAALLAAQQLAASCGSGGVLVALPTRATSDAMFDRVRRWAQLLVDDGDIPLYLAHGKSALNEDFQRLPQVRLSAVGVDSFGPEVGRGRGTGAGAVVAYQWMRGRKRGVLSSFVVGTVDQLLFMGLKSRHLALRHLAVSGKVVVVDEVHSYDAYMSSYLQVALRWLAAYRVPVVLLSATLAPSVRRSLLEAYAGGLPAGRRARRPDWSAQPEPPSPAPVDDAADGYPRLEWRGLDGAVRVRGVRPPVGAEIALERIGGEDADLAGLLQERLREGGCALVIRNTVREVQATAALLTGVFGEDIVSVAHSRFIATDRAAIDRDLVQRFGPSGDRPHRAVVVASQVAEQSLDVDFDLLVSDIAPIDLLLQRAGRLHRHHGRGRPAPVASPVLVLRGVDDWGADVPEPGAGTARVYSSWLLLRTLAVLHGRRSIRVPGDVPGLVAEVYDGPPLLEGPMAAAELPLRKRHEDRQADRGRKATYFQIGRPAQGSDLVGWLDTGVGEADDTAAGRSQVRDAPEGLEVIALHRAADGSLGLMPWMEPLGVDLSGPVPVEYPQDRRVALSMLALPSHLSGMDVIDELEEFMPDTFQESPWLKGELVLVFDDHGRARLAGRSLTYSRRYGLQEVTDER